jgi:hypothetical protein
VHSFHFLRGSAHSITGGIAAQSFDRNARRDEHGRANVAPLARRVEWRISWGQRAEIGTGDGPARAAETAAAVAGAVGSVGNPKGCPSPVGSLLSTGRHFP